MPSWCGTDAQPLADATTNVATDLRRAANVAKQIYGREELDSFGDTNALDVLRRLPGVNVGAGGRGAQRLRGFTASAWLGHCAINR